MEEKQNKQELVTRLALCAGIAIALFYGAEKLGTALKIALWTQYRPWLEAHKTQVIAATAAVLFAVSLVLFPRGAPKEAAEPEDIEGFESCAGDCDIP